MPRPDWMTEASAIRRRLNDLINAGQRPVAIVLGPEIYIRQREAAGGAWELQGRGDLFGYPVERGRDEGWSVRVRMS